jgi:WD40 repeat protein
MNLPHHALRVGVLVICATIVACEPAAKPADTTSSADSDVTGTQDTPDTSDTVAPAPIAPIGEMFGAGTTALGDSVALSADGKRLVAGGSGYGTHLQGLAIVYERDGDAWVQVGDTIIGEADSDHFGFSVAISSTGDRVAIGAPYSTGAERLSGNVRVFDLVGDTWTQVGADIEPSPASQVGYSIALSASGHRVTFGAPSPISRVGVAYVYELIGGVWTPLVDVFRYDSANHLGNSVDISDDGNRLFIAAYGAAFGAGPGTVVVYDWDGASWGQFGAPLVGAYDPGGFGFSVSASSDGTRVAVSANIDGTNGAAAGAVRVFELEGGVWKRLGQEILGDAPGDNFSHSVALSGDGEVLVATNATKSVVRVYTLIDGAWVQLGVDLSGMRSHDVAISADGSTLVVGHTDAGGVRTYAITR